MSSSSSAGGAAVASINSTAGNIHTSDTDEAFARRLQAQEMGTADQATPLVRYLL
jgi:hypothetical protein